MRTHNSIHNLLFIRIAALVMLLIAPEAFLAQDFKLEVGGKVEKGGKKLEGAMVSLYSNGQLVKKVSTSSNGKFNFELTSNNDYEITVTKAGFITKRFTVTTKSVPSKRAEFGFGGFEFTVTIFEEVENVDYSILDQPIAKINYDAASEDFNFNQKYTESMLEALAKLKALEEESQKEQERLAKEAAEKLKQQQQAQNTTNSSYTDAVEKGNKAFTAKKYEEAIAAFRQAQGIKPDEQYPKDKIAEINKLLEQLANDQRGDEKYKAIIAKADKEFTERSFTNAISSYKEALALKPTDKYPKDKIAEIEKIISDLQQTKDIEEKYKAAIAKADNAFSDKDYSNAKIFYNEAISYKGNEKYPKDRINEIDQILSQLAKGKLVDEKYNAAIAAGDKAFGEKDYTSAKNSYNEALTYKAAEKYPKDKITEIDKLLADATNAKALEEKYKAAIAAADKAFRIKNYADAKNSYNEALKYKSGEQYPKDKIAEIDKLLGDQVNAKALEEKYKAAIAAGDNSFKTKNYAAAKTSYNEALTYKANEQYPKDKITEINKLLGDLANAKALEEKYNAAIALGDKAFGTKDYTTAKSSYNEALTYKAGEKYPKDKITEIDKLLADAANAKTLEEKYKAAIAAGDKAFGTKDYIAAKSSFNEALTYKAGEKYPKDKINEIDKLLADIAGTKALEEKYNAAIAAGDKAFGTKDYTAAKNSYNEALKYKANEPYPKDKITEIDKLLADLANAKALEEKYKAAIISGDNAFKIKNYVAAKTSYNEALSYKANEQYPKDKITEIDKLLGDLANAKTLEEKYNAAIAAGDKAFGTKDYTAAKNSYNEALTYKAGEKYPKDKITEIDKLLADAANAKTLEEKYKAAIAVGDKAFGTKDYIAAKSSFNEALTYKATEKYPKDKIIEIDKLLADMANTKALEEKYNAAIAVGDKAFGTKDYATAKSSYNEALKYKVNEPYPKDKITVIDKLLADAANAKALEEKYKAAIASGDNAFKIKNYVAAKTSYNEALSYKANEQYPKDKITEINKLLGDLANAKALEEKYNTAIADGDKAFGTKDYTAAKNSYNEALTYKAGEKYPKDKITEIDKLLADAVNAKALEEKYNAAIAAGDKAFGTKNYTTAKASFNEALTYKAAEKYPKDKITEIDKLLGDAANAKALEEKYNAALAAGDKAFGTKDYTIAKSSYNEALIYKANEKYPKDKITEIDKLLADLANAKALDEKYNAAITTGDKAFGIKDYTTAKKSYNEALTYKTGEKYPKDKITEIDKLLADLANIKALEEKYNAAITLGDKAFGTKDYTSAKNSYNEALTYKAGEKYPKDKIAEIDKLLTDMTNAKALEEKYNIAITTGDKAFAAKDYTAAKSSYTEALTYKAGEKYPKDKITEIDKILDAIARQKELEKKYNDAITKADKLFLSKDYKISKGSYNEALSYKPNEKYPKDKIAEIDKLLAQQPTAAVTATPEPGRVYTDGVTEELSQEGNCKVTKRVVVRDGIQRVYMKKVWGWGGVFYFKDGVSITPDIFETETK